MRKLEKDKENQIIQNYICGKPIKDIMSIYDVSNGSVYNVLKRNHIERVGQDRFKYKVDRYYFDKIDTQDKAYWLGMLAADGNNTVDFHRKRYSVKLGLKKSDRKLLEEFKKCIKFQGPIIVNKEKRVKSNGERFGQDQHCVSINDKYFALSLMRKGIVPNKTSCLEMPDLSDDLILHFIRGYFDGDGCISNAKTKTGYFCFNVSFAGAKSFINTASHLLLGKFGIRSSVIKQKNIYLCSLMGWENAKFFLDSIYSEARIFLDRKYRKYLEFCDRFTKIKNLGHNNKGENNPNSKLSETDVRHIRQFYSNGLRVCDIHKKYNTVSWETIKSIVDNKTWKNVPNI